MATESPIRMIEAHQKWPSYKVAETYVSSSTSMGVVEACPMYLRSTIIPNRSGSAPPSVEGSIAAIGNLMQSSVSHVAGHGRNWRSASFDSSSNDALHMSRHILPTHKEEPEDDRLPQQTSVDGVERNSTALSKHESSSSVARNRSLLEITQEDSSRPDVVHDSSQTSLYWLVSKAPNPDIHHMSQDDQTVGELNAVASSSNSDVGVSVITSSRSSSHDVIGGASSSFYRENSLDVPLVKDTIVSSDSSTTRIQSGMKTLRITHSPNAGNQKNGEDMNSVCNTDIDQHQTQHRTNLQFQGFAPRMVSQGIGIMYGGNNQASNVGKSSSVEVQPMLQSSGFTPFHAASTTYTPYPSYSNVQTPGFMCSPSYGIGGYAFNMAIYPPYYSPHSTMPSTFDGADTHNYSIRNSVVPFGGAVDMQLFNKLHGPLGVTQPPFLHPCMQLNQPFPYVYNAIGQVDPLVAKGGVIGNQVSAFNFHLGPSFAGFPAYSRSEYQGAAGRPNLIQRRGKVSSSAYSGSPTNMGAFKHVSSSTMGSPALPVPFAGDGFPGVRNEQSLPQASGRILRFCANWPGQRTAENLNSPKTHSILEELKSGKSRSFELSNIAGHVAELSVDQHGSLFIQQKLKHCSSKEKASVFNEVLPHASKLMTDVFGNYVIQKFFEYGTPEQRKELANRLSGQILPLSLQMYGCRVIQKALDVIELDQKVGLVRELDEHVIRCVCDQTGNHVIQKCIETMPIEKIDFIIHAFRGHVADLSTHPYGCRVIQRVLERCTSELPCQYLVDEILESVCDLAKDQYGNYVTQHVLEKGKPQERSEIIRKLAGRVVQLSQHKFASNVVEKCLEYGDAADRELLIGEITGKGEGNDSLLIMMKDQYANYVVKKILEKCTESQRDMLYSRVKGHLHALKKYTYGKHIVSCFEQHFGEETEASGS